MSSSTPLEVDIVIIGSGLAGLSAALEASATNTSTRILILEKEGKVGGNSAKASSGINAAVSTDDIQIFQDDTLKSGQGYSNPELVQTLVKNSADAIEFLRQNGADLSVLSQLGGHSAKRTLRNANGPNVGLSLIQALNNSVEAVGSPRISVITGAKVTSIRQNDALDGRIEGVVFHTQEGEKIATAPAVILATGGYSSNKDLLKRLAPGMEMFATTNGPWATGDGLALGEAVGAALVGTDQVQLHPTGLVDPANPDSPTKFLAPEALRGSGGILLNREGKRFVNELGRRDEVSKAILAQTDQTAYLLLSKESAEKFGSAVKFYVFKGIAAHKESLEELAAYMNLDREHLRMELNHYAQVSADPPIAVDPFGKTVFPTAFPTFENPGDQPCDMTVMRIVPVVHYCMGGLKIDATTQVLTESGPVDGLFAAGEVTGGLHGGNRLGGNSLLDCVVFGRIAGQQASLRSKV